MPARRFVIVAVALFASLGASCDRSPSEPSGPVNLQVELAPGQSASIAGTNLSIRFERVVSDSRCPGDAICISAGEAVVAVQVLSGATAAGRYEVRTDPPARRRAAHGDLTIELTRLDPYPFLSRPFPPSDYRAHLRVSRP